jgi:hypothetical protein
MALRTDALRNLPTSLFVASLGCCTMILLLVCLVRWRARDTRAKVAAAIQSAPPQTPIDEPATLAELGLIKNR